MMRDCLFSLLRHDIIVFGSRKSLVDILYTAREDISLLLTLIDIEIDIEIDTLSISASFYNIIRVHCFLLFVIISSYLFFAI